MFRSSKSFLVSANLLSVIFIGIGLTSPSLNESLSLWVLLASVFIVGIPHGAIDHIIASELFENHKGLRGHLIFYSSYLLIMAILGIVWFLSPSAGMIIFLAISIYHFGQADMEEFMRDGHARFFWNMLRGCFIIGLILFSDTDKTFPVISDATGIPLSTFNSVFAEAGSVTLFLVLFYFIFSVYAVYKNRIQHPIIFLSDGALLTALFLIAGPFIGFAIYFAVWHSSGHIHEMIQFFNARNKPFNLKDFVLKSLPFTLISVLGLAALHYIHVLIGSGLNFITLMFILISVLTLPHMVIVDMMYSRNQV